MAVIQTVENASNFPMVMKEVRYRLNMSQEQLAREIGVSFATVNRWENGHVQPSRLSKHYLLKFLSRAEEAEDLMVIAMETTKTDFFSNLMQGNG